MVNRIGDGSRTQGALACAVYRSGRIEFAVRPSDFCDSAVLAYATMESRKMAQEVCASAPKKAHPRAMELVNEAWKRAIRALSQSSLEDGAPEVDTTVLLFCQGMDAYPVLAPYGQDGRYQDALHRPTFRLNTSRRDALRLVELFHVYLRDPSLEAQMRLQPAAMEVAAQHNGK